MQGGCGVQLGGRLQQYASCNSLQGAGAGYSLLWTLQAPRADGMSVLDLAIEAPSTGWVGWGIPATPGEMVGANAIVVRADPAAPTGLQPRTAFWAHMHVQPYILVLLTRLAPGASAAMPSWHGAGSCCDAALALLHMGRLDRMTCRMRFVPAPG